MSTHLICYKGQLLAPTEDFCHNLSFWVLSQFEFISLVTIWIFEFCHNLSFFCCHNLSSWVCHNLIEKKKEKMLQIFVSLPSLLSLMSQLSLLSLLSQMSLLICITIWFLEFGQNLSFWVLSQFEFSSFVTIWFF